MRDEVFVFKCQATHRTNVYAFGALAAGCFANRFVLEGGDRSFETPPGESNSSNAQFFLTYPDAFAAEDTFVGIIGKEETAIIDGEASSELSESFCRQFYSKVFGNFLKFTGSAL